MKRLLEKMSILGLSALLISSYSISSAIPYMLAYYSDRAASEVELLISLPSFMILFVLVNNRLISSFLKERQLIVLGLVTMGVAGSIPVFVQSYPVLFLSRLFLGLGIGLINAKAISMISEHFQGEERTSMQGFRASAEVVGASFLTFLVGFLITFNWYLAFSVYSFAFVVLVCYLLFVPQESQSIVENSLASKTKLGVLDFRQALWYAVLAGMGVFVNTVVNIRTPIMGTEMRLGTASQISFLLSLQQLIGILSGILFAFLLKKMEKKLTGFASVGLGVTYFVIGSASSLFLLGFGMVASGFFYSLFMTVLFYEISERIPIRQLNNATAIVLIGCNMGSAFSPYILKGLGIFLATNGEIFIFLSACMLLLGVYLFLLTLGKKTGR